MANLRCTCGSISLRFSSWKCYLTQLPKYHLTLIWKNNIHTTAPLLEGNQQFSRRKRDRLTVLKALASTVDVLQNKPDYRFFDDPVLLPKTLRKQKEALLAIQSGEKFANEVINEFSHLFPFRVPEPSWPDRLSSKHLLAKEVSVVGLKELIKNGENSLKVVEWYKLLCSKDEEVSIDVHNDVLDFASFHAISEDGEIPKANESLEASSVDEIDSLWTEENFAEKLFQQLINHGNVNGRTYEVYILGLLKHGQNKNAFETFTELVDKKLHGSLFLYNLLLENVLPSEGTDDERWNLAQDIVSAIRENSIKPNVVTFNQLMAIASERMHGGGTLCLHLLREMKNLGISPSLGTYHFLIVADKKEDIMEANLLRAILGDLRKGVVDYVLQHPSDLKFFHSAMDLARYKRRGDLARQLFNLVKTNKIENLISQISAFYGNYLATIARHSKVDELYNEYRQLVPAFFIPRDWMLEQIFYAFRYHKNPKYIPELFSDMISLRIPITPRGINSLFSAMSVNVPKERSNEFFFVVSEAEKWMEVYNIPKSRETQSVALKIFCLDEKYDKVMEKIAECKMLKIVPSAEAMLAVLELTVDNGQNNDDALETLELIAKYNMKLTGNMIELINSHPFLNNKKELIESWF